LALANAEKNAKSDPAQRSPSRECGFMAKCERKKRILARKCDNETLAGARESLYSRQSLGKRFGQGAP
jgi:hypothetical protein